MHRRLPHFEKRNAAYFVTWHLSGSLPACAIADIRMPDGPKFVSIDRLLDAAAWGSRWLSNSEAASAVAARLLQSEIDGYCELGAFVLMPNHVHMIFRPRGALCDSIAAIKARTGRDANRVLKRSGPFWARDYFDRWIRDRNEERRITRYIENNPVKAGLCCPPEEWPCSSARRGERRASSG